MDELNKSIENQSREDSRRNTPKNGQREADHQSNTTDDKDEADGKGKNDISLMNRAQRKAEEKKRRKALRDKEWSQDRFHSITLQNNYVIVIDIFCCSVIVLKTAKAHERKAK